MAIGDEGDEVDPDRSPIAGRGPHLMTLLRRDALKYALSATGMVLLAAVAAPAVAVADGVQLSAFNVKAYGATGDGTTDDTAAIHAARDAAGVGGLVIIPPGTYLVSGLAANVASQRWDLSDGAVIKMKVGAAVPLSVTASGVSVTGGVFDCSDATRDKGGKNGITITADGVTIRQVRVLNSPYHGIAAYACNQITISGCSVTNSAGAGIWAQNGSLPSIYDIVIMDNMVDNSSAGKLAEGIGVRGNKNTQRVSRVTVSRNTVCLPYGQSGQTGNISVTNGTDWIIQNNTIIGGYFGITCPDPIRASISINVIRGFNRIGIEIPGAVDDVTVMGNIVDPDGTPASSGIQASAGPVSDLSIVGNTIRNFSASCYLIDFSSGSRSERVKIIGNFLKSAVGSGSFSGVYFNGEITGLDISGNIVEASSSAKSWGVRFLNSVTGAAVTGNRFADLTGGAVLLAARGASYKLDHISVVANELVNCGATLQDSTSEGAVVGPNIFT